MYDLSFEYEIAQLDIGDMILKDNSDNDLLIIERKTINDLASSIIDGRYNEQSFRLNALPIHNHNIIYLIEGNINHFKERNTIKKKTLYSTLFKLQYYKGFSVARTIDIQETIEYIIRMLDKINREKSIEGYYNGNICQEIDYTQFVKKEKKSNITNKNINYLMLSQIPGISVTTAKNILNNMTLHDFITKIKNEEKYLEKVEYIGNNGKLKKIPKNIIQSLYIFLK